ncbi:MAG: hypothetical protein Q4F84_08205, partial [Fibrobacter sp.]|nr:hypothetical protein [Fibrobacter sp.]
KRETMLITKTRKVKKSAKALVRALRKTNRQQPAQSAKRCFLLEQDSFEIFQLRITHYELIYVR